MISKKVPATSLTVKKFTNIKLNDEQQQLKSRIIEFTKQNLQRFNSNSANYKPSVFVINGDPGTGKSIIINSLFNEFQRIAKTTKNDILSNRNNYLVVNHPEMLKLYYQISKSFTFIKKSELERPTSLINKYLKQADCLYPIDILIIDEAHLLASSKDSFKKFHQNNHFEELLKISKVVIVVFDEHQSLRMGSFWNLNSQKDGATLYDYLGNKSLVNSFEMHQLTKQFRVVAQPDLLDWIANISITKKILPLPTKDLEMDNGFEFKLFNSCSTMYEHIKEKNAKFGQARILATYDFPYRLDGKDYFVTSQSDDFKLRWDRYMPQLTTPWSERDDTIAEVGSVYTIQGFDLNYAGVILGRSIGYDKETDSIKIKPEFYDDNAGFTKKKNIKHVDQVKEKIILNSLNVLLTRGVRGLYLFAWDNELRERLLKDADLRLVV